MKITTWNINSIRKRFDIVHKVLNEIEPDIFCLQEIKVTTELFPYDFFNNLGYVIQCVRGQSGYNGVAILGKPGTIKYVQETNLSSESRHLSVLLSNDVELHNFYIPAGGDIADPEVNEKFKYKLQFLDEIVAWFSSNRCVDDKIILVGDLNVAPLENDVWSHKQLLKVVSHTPIEIGKINSLYKSIDFSDAIRKFTPPEKKLYSWWSYRNRDWRKSDRGRRLDHIWVTQPLKPYIAEGYIAKEVRGYLNPSDHCPVTIRLSEGY
jgi:exodeoxyribonuclease-3